MSWISDLLFSEYSGPIWAFLGMAGAKLFEYFASRNKDRREDLVAAAQMHANLNKDLQTQIDALNSELKRLRSELRASAARDAQNVKRIGELELELAALRQQLELAE